jgi:hypothetical protein
MATTCIHGYPPGSCLICQTLGQGPDDPESGRTKTRRRRSNSVESPVAAAPATRPTEGPAPARRGSLGLRLTGLALAVVIAALVVWWVIGLVWAVLHVLEIVAAALAAGYIGFRLGTVHGRRSARRH